jgi:hypothetical protein
MDNDEIIEKVTGGIPDEMLDGVSGKKLNEDFKKVAEAIRADGFKEGWKEGVNAGIEERKNNEKKIRADERAQTIEDLLKLIKHLSEKDNLALENLFERGRKVTAKRIFAELDKIKLYGYNCDLWLVEDYQNIKKHFLGE